MANWITHTRIADILIGKGLNVDIKGFCIGNIAPDCNIENEDWTAYIPETPLGYTITEQYTDDNSCIIIYSDSNEREIIYSYSNIENINVSIDNEDSDFKETTINGCKGYSSAKDDTNALYWASGTYFYELQGTCDIDTLYQMAKSLVQ